MQNFIKHSEIRKFLKSLFSIVQIWVLRVNFFFQFLVDIFPLGSGSVDPHIFTDPDPESQNLSDPKRCLKALFDQVWLRYQCSYFFSHC